MVNNHFIDFSIFTNFNFHQTSPADTGDVYTFFSVPSLKVKRTSSLLKTVTKSTRLYQRFSSNSVATPSCRSSSTRNLSICSFFACFSVMALPTSSSLAFVWSNRSASPSYLAWYSIWSRATWAFSSMHCCISPATTFSSS